MNYVTSLYRTHAYISLWQYLVYASLIKTKQSIWIAFSPSVWCNLLICMAIKSLRDNKKCYLTDLSPVFIGITVNNHLTISFQVKTKERKLNSVLFI